MNLPGFLAPMTRWFRFLGHRPGPRLIAGFAFLGLVLGFCFFHWLRSNSTRPQIDLTANPVQFREGSLRIWALSQTADQPDFQQALSDFEKDQQVSVDVVRFDNLSLLAAALDSEEARRHPPDLFFTDALLASQLDAQKRLAKQILPQDNQIALRLEAMSPFRVGPTLRAWPTDLSFRVLFYNRSVLQSQGLAEPGPHWTWEILLGMARTLYRPVEKSTDPVFWGLELPLDVEMWNIFAAQSGAMLYSGNTFRMGRPEDALLQAQGLEALLQFFQTYAILPPPSSRPDKTEFENNHSAFLIGDSTLCERFKTLPFQWGMTCLPRGDKRATSSNVLGWAIPANTGHLEVSRLLAQKLAAHPALRGTLGALTSSEVDENWADALTKSLPDAQPPFAAPRAESWRQKINAELAVERSQSKTDGLLFVERAISALNSLEDTPPDSR